MMNKCCALQRPLPIAQRIGELDTQIAGHSLETHLGVEVYRSWFADFLCGASTVPFSAGTSKASPFSTTEISMPHREDPLSHVGCRAPDGSRYHLLKLLFFMWLLMPNQLARAGDTSMSARAKPSQGSEDAKSRRPVLAAPACLLRVRSGMTGQNDTLAPTV